MAKRKKSKANRWIVGTLLLLASAFFIYNTVSEVSTMIELKAAIKDASDEESNLKQQKADLETDKENLNNPEYILRYARGKYLATKEDGEQVFKLPDSTSDDTSGE